MVKQSKKPVIWIIVGTLVAVFLMLPALYPEARSISSHFFRIQRSDEGNESESTVLSWFSWSNSSYHSDLSANKVSDLAPAVMDGTLNSKIQCESHLKVFMYDIPRRFNLGMLKKSDTNRDLPWTERVAPPWPQRSGLKKQHSVEYWMMVDILDEPREKDVKRAAVRVSDPEQADVFFVPFFSSLSFNTYGQNMRDPATEIDKKLQVDIVTFLKASKWWQASQGRDHVLVLHHPNAFRFFRDELNASMLIVADFGRLSKSTAQLRKDVVAPYAHIVPTFENDDTSDPFESRTTLLFFQGRIARKDDGIIRSRLAKILSQHAGVHFMNGIATKQGLAQATEGMRLSRFCLHPAGDTPSSCRLFDAIVSHCVPVIISDKIELPFEDELNYTEFALFFSVEEAIRPGYLLDYLNGFDRERWLQMWNRLKDITHHFEYQHPSRRDDAVNMIWKEVHRKIPAVKLAIHRAQRLKIADWWRR